ncbi:cobyrinate a,c-diamide synthase [Deinococcus metallilatus]|uniref:Cobyrinate a,c-diamide synthase n=1 Tax=Deinococcus metallilatus TaxID=1211322 RepID=A0AAJ5F4F9_9DEIO|nr:cobyrinate a,c-diamide synthase [Deinococcus metallilatus]MBB5294405.1 cobyrinic acid a,c-diamide synthase [Deinococcus metallilatus]QBY10158.1 cobyrinate a,c-diamide synthase [Deinococcus metallilatus]RXJ13884.1 cobyrinate a,c-diamide synthase [Deinococcus metallilatus]TLK29850.1 cobyrinate a,c-diamide synthase [Deinococcus metallilatus]GMA15621.1 cobyrinic acid a,c-diamide synthase [Deinococcus metallilatus]
MKRLVLAAPHSGSGKTTVAALLCLALRHRGLKVAPFKLGPDYLDPTHLTRAAGRPARNLDSFLLPPERLRHLFARAAAAADLSVLEGVMGLYDGRDPASDAHSTADLARLLAAPVVLVIDAGGSARTVAAVAHGLRSFGPDLKVVGVILNRVAGERHAALCEVALAQIGLPLLGFVPDDPALHLPARHLGLLSAERASWDEAQALRAAGTLKLDALLELADAPPLPLPTPPVPSPGHRARLAYALDEAFHFYYPDALDELRDAGAELVPFSPLRDAGLPPGVGGVLLGGGYPEAHAAELSANTSMRLALRAFAATGRPVIGECGGLMYLAETLEDADGNCFEMCGVLPYRTRMAPRLTLGYREATALTASPLAPAGTVLRGHEFHHSVLTHAPTHPAYTWMDGTGQRVEEGYARGNVLASYLHLHYGAEPEQAARLVAACS